MVGAGLPLPLVGSSRDSFFWASAYPAKAIERAAATARAAIRSIKSRPLVEGLSVSFSDNIILVVSFLRFLYLLASFNFTAPRTLVSQVH
jgi:hypothetical protein